jgi:hypothetical protein
METTYAVVDVEGVRAHPEMSKPANKSSDKISERRDLRKNHSRGTKTSAEIGGRADDCITRVVLPDPLTDDGRNKHE